MNKLPLIFIFLAVFSSVNVAAEAKREHIEPFYDFLSNPSSQSYADKVSQSLAKNWASIGDYSGAKKSREKFIKQVKGFGQLIPDLTWAIEEVITSGDKVVVRSRATGTPKGPFFGVDGKGKSFDIAILK